VRLPTSFPTKIRRLVSITGRQLKYSFDALRTAAGTSSIGHRVERCRYCPQIPKSMEIVEATDEPKYPAVPVGTAVIFLPKSIGGYSFRWWSDGSTELPRAVEVKGNMRLEALYSHSVGWIATGSGVPLFDSGHPLASVTMHRACVHEWGVGVKCDVLSFKWSAHTTSIEGFSACSSDVDGDGEVEVVFVGYLITSEWPPTYEYYMYCAKGSDGTIKWTVELSGFVKYVALYDVDGDGLVEILATCEDGHLYCFRGDGSLKWAAFTGEDQSWCMPAIADVDGDGEVEVVFGDASPAVHCAKGSDGTIKWTYQCPPGSISPTCISIGDVDGDGRLEVVASLLAGYVVCLGGDGRERWRFALRGWAGSEGCSLYDVDGDGMLEVVCNEDWPPAFLCIDHDGSLKWRYVPEHEECEVYVPAVCVYDVDGDGVPEAIAGSTDSHMYCLDAYRGALKWRFETWAVLETSGCVADIDGDGEYEVFVGARDGFVYVLSRYGSLEARAELPSNICFFLDVACIDDVDGDGKIEICFPCYGDLLCLEPTSLSP